MEGNEGFDPGTNNGSGNNPAWNDVLGVIPQELHEQVMPHFQKWDQSAQQRIEEVNSQVKNYEPYKGFVDNGISPQELEQGLRLMYEINTNPQSVYEQLGKAFSFGGEQNPDPNAQNQGQQNQQQAQNDPRYDRLQQGMELVSQIVLRDQEEKKQAQQAVALQNELDGLRKKHGDYDERFVLAMMQNGMTGEQAVQEFQKFTSDLIQKNPRPFAPNIMGNSSGGTGYPSQAIDPRKLSGKDTRSLVAQMIQAAQNQ